MTTEIVKHQPTAATLPEKMQYAKALAASGMLPGQYRQQPANLLYALEYAESLGLHPMAAITGIHVIEGKPSASAALISALVRRAGHKLRVKGDDNEAVAQIIRADDPDFVYEARWTKARAEQAGLARKDVWKKYPAAMLKARAITEVARDACEEALSGMHYTPEELGAQVDADGEPVNAEVQQLRPVPTGEPDQWAAPAPARDWVAEAEAAPGPETVRELWQAAKGAGASDDVLAQLVEIGRAKTAEATAAAEAQTEPVDAEIVPDADTDHAAAVADLRAAAEAAHLDNFDEGAEQALGLPVEEASAASIRALAAQIRGAA